MNENPTDQTAHQESTMRQRLLDALTHPRACVLDKIHGRDCPHDGIFEPADTKCIDCDLGKGCYWLRCLKKLSGLESRPTHTIHASLLYGLRLVEAGNNCVKHDPGVCGCDSCTWILETRKLAEEFQSLSLGDRFRSVYLTTPWA